MAAGFRQPCDALLLSKSTVSIIIREESSIQQLLPGKISDCESSFCCQLSLTVDALDTALFAAFATTTHAFNVELYHDILSRSYVYHSVWSASLN